MPADAADSADASPRRRPGLPSAVLLAFVALGVAFRVWVLMAPFGSLDADGAVVGLMARHVQDGEFSVFYWGQSYGGSLEAVLAALGFMVFGPSDSVLMVVPVVLSGLAALVCWQIGRPLVGDQGARTGALVFWVGSAGLLWWTTHVGTYWASLCLGLLALLILVRAPEDRVWPARTAAAFGLIVGLAWWANLQTMFLLAPAGLFYARKLLRQWRQLPILVPAALLGALPWIVFNVRNDWASLHLAEQGTEYGYLDHLHGFVHVAFPMLLGFRIPMSQRWLPWASWGYWVVLVVLVVAVVRWRRGRGVLLAIALAYPFIYSLSPYVWFVAHTRYLLFLWPVVALLVGGLLGARRSLAVAGLTAVAALSLIGLRDMDRTLSPLPGGPDVRTPADFSDLERLLRRERVNYAFADYWIAYKATFETDERVIVTSLGTLRYRPYHDAVRSAPRPAYVFLTQSRTYAQFQELCRAKGIGLRTVEQGQFAVAVPDRKLLPEEVSEAWHLG